MTTLHGDPDIFVSRTEKFPNPYQFEKRSIRCGIYPEQVEYVKEANKTLEGDYYVTIYGFVQSVYSILYYTEQEATIGTTVVPIIKLVNG